MQAGRYTVRANWRPKATGDRFLVHAVIEFEESGTVFVHVHGEPLFAFPNSDEFFGAYSIRRAELESLRRPGLTRTRPPAQLQAQVG